MKIFNLRSFNVMLTLIGFTLTSTNCYAEDYVWIKPTEKSCHKVTEITSSYGEKIGEILHVPVSSVHLIRVVCDIRNGYYVVVDTSNGPKNCGMPGIIKFSNGVFAADDSIKMSDGSLMSAINNKMACELY